ncbi:MAG: hypothetical protein PHE72_14850, partial [candidate division Zixibacteria bacterium]|nr:hypothetical protein [candidate division Zixibacteria bacterium]
SSSALCRFTSLTGATSVTAENLTGGRVVIAADGGLLSDDEDLTFDGTTLTAAEFHTSYGGSATISDFSSDTSLTADSDSALPTHRAVKAYVDSKSGGGLPAPGTVANILRDTGSAWATSSQLQVWDYGSGQGAVDIQGKLSFFNDTDTFISGYNNLYFTVNNTERMQLTGDGHLQLNYASPLTAPDPAIQFANSLGGIGYSSTDQHIIYVSVNGATRFSVADSVGIPPYVRVWNAGNQSTPAFAIGTDGSNFNTGLFVTGGTLGLTAAGTERLRIKDTGQVNLVPLAGTYPAAAGASGDLYFDNDDNALKYYNGADWVVLTGSGGGAGDFATRALDNLSGVAINDSLLPGADDSIDLGDPTHEWKDLYVDGTANIDSLVADTADINAGTVDGTAIGQAAAGLGSFTRLTATTSIAAASGAAVDEFSTDGTLAGDSDTALPTEQAVKTYVDGQFTSQSWTSGTGADTYVTYWTGENTISGESPFAYDPATDKLVLAGSMEVTSSADGLTTGMVYLSASGDNSNALYVDKPDGNYAAVNVNVQTDATGAALRIRNTGEGAGSYGIDIGQFTSHTAAHALNINNDGLGSAINISHSAASLDKAVWVYNESAKGAFWIRQEGNIANTAVNDSAGGALHVYNNGNTGSAITAYSSETASSALVWFRASYQPVLRVEGLTNRANPFWLVPQDKPAGAIAYTVQTGEMYMGTDGSLNYYKGDGWERLVGRWTVETCVLTDADTFNPDTPAITGQRNFNEGRPLRYRGDSSDPWLYGMVAGYAPGAVTVAGAALPDPLAEIEVGKPELIRQINFFEPGNLVQGDDFMSPNTWEMQEGYIVRATAKVETA